MRDLSRRTLITGITAATLRPSGLFAADAIVDFYHGKSIRLLIGAAAAGGYDVAGRLVAEFLGHYIPGNPAITVENMPGATSLVMTNYLYNGAARDGTVIGMPNNNVLLEPRLQLLSRNGGNAQFDVSQLSWIGTPVQDPQVLWVWSSAASNLGDLRTRKVVMGSTGPGADNYSLPQMVNSVLGTKLDIVTGYQGQNDIFLAVERGEAQGNTAGFSDLVTKKSRWIAEGTIRILIQFGASRLAALPDVPTATELAASADDKDLFRFEASKFAAARPIASPPHVPQDRLRVLQNAFAATMRDPLYQTQARRIGLPLNPLGGREIAKLIAKIDSTPQPVIDRLRAILLSAPH